MADQQSFVAQEVMKLKPVQELVMSNKNNDDDDDVVVPERYIYKDNSYGAINNSVPALVEIPVIDFGHLTNSSSSSLQELEKLRSALAIWGYFQVINHEIENPLLDEVREVARQFFSLPMQEKRKYERVVDDIEGYGNDAILSDDQTLDWTDRLYLQVNPEDGRKYKYWPENPKSFREVLHEYTRKIELIGKQLLKSIARSLTLEEKCFLNQCGERQIIVSRFNYYPPCPKPELVLGLKAHADGSTITILLQDKQVQGLQVLKDDQWFQVPIMSHALLVNIGDQLEIMSNGVIKSPVHRVVTNSMRERITVAMFFAPEAEKEIEPSEELVSESRPKMFRKVKNYNEDYFHYYQQGKRPLDALKI